MENQAKNIWASIQDIVKGMEPIDKDIEVGLEEWAKSDHIYVYLLLSGNKTLAMYRDLNLQGKSPNLNELRGILGGDEIGRGEKEDWIIIFTPIWKVMGVVVRNNYNQNIERIFKEEKEFMSRVARVNSDVIFFGSLYKNPGKQMKEFKTENENKQENKLTLPLLILVVVIIGAVIFWR